MWKQVCLSNCSMPCEFGTTYNDFATATNWKGPGETKLKVKGVYRLSQLALVTGLTFGLVTNSIVLLPTDTIWSAWMTGLWFDVLQTISLNSNGSTVYYHWHSCCLAFNTLIANRLRGSRPEQYKRTVCPPSPHIGPIENAYPVVSSSSSSLLSSSTSDRYFVCSNQTVYGSNAITRRQTDERDR